MAYLLVSSIVSSSQILSFTRAEPIFHALNFFNSVFITVHLGMGWGRCCCFLDRNARRQRVWCDDDLRAPVLASCYSGTSKLRCSVHIHQILELWGEVQAGDTVLRSSAYSRLLKICNLYHPKESVQRRDWERMPRKTSL